MSTSSNATSERYRRAIALMGLMATIIVTSSHLRADTGTCGGASITLPFTDVMNSTFFCQIAEAYFSGLTDDTAETKYGPSNKVRREHMAAFTTRTMDQSLKRGSRRAALDQYWTTQGASNVALTAVGSGPEQVKSDGTDLWVANYVGATVSRVRASDGKLLATWTGANSAWGVLCAMGKVFVTGATSPGTLYQIDPTQPAGSVTILSSSLGNAPTGIGYDGQRIWTANAGSVSIITLNPMSVTTPATKFASLTGIIYDGANIWVKDGSLSKLHKLDSNGLVLLTVEVGGGPSFPAFDGTNIWVPNSDSNTVSVVRATGSLAGTVLATLSVNGTSFPYSAAFDGERILVTNSSGDGVSLWKAADFTPIGSFSIGVYPRGACSDGLNFWISLYGAGKLARF